MNETDAKVSAAAEAGDFNPEQKRYLEGFVAGAQIARAAKGLGGAAGGRGVPRAEPVGPDAAATKGAEPADCVGRQTLRSGKVQARRSIRSTLTSRLKDHAAKGEYPKPADNFRWRFFGLFYVAPNQNSYMCRLRIPNGILNATQFAGVADLAERYGGGYAHVTTRANLQIREIEAANSVAVIEAIQDLGLCSRGSGADNIRNVTGTPTAGIDPQELIDTRPYAREWHFHILNDRSLYGLPRKFNVAFDGAGTIAVLEDTNDIGFQAVEVNDGFGLSPGVWFKLTLGGITGHRDFARDTGAAGAAEGRLRGRRRGGAGLYRSRQPRRSNQGTIEICARRHGRRKVRRTARGKTRPQARPGGARARSNPGRFSIARRTSASMRKNSKA